MNWFINFLLSNGVKRKIAAVLSTLIGLCSAVPELAFAIPVLTQLAGLFGVVGAVQATAVKTISKAKLGYIVSVLQFIILLAQYIPALQPYVELLQKLASLLGAGALGAMVIKK